MEEFLTWLATGAAGPALFGLPFTAAASSLAAMTRKWFRRVRRADWLLPDGTYVECAGMLESKDYAEKIAVKQELARALGLALIVVGPTEMHRLGQIFGRQLEWSAD